MTKAQQRSVLMTARKLLSERFKTSDALIIGSPDDVRHYLQMKFMDRMDIEHFDVLFLDNQNRLTRHLNIAKGTIDACPVYPREIARKALLLNAKSVILAHNHPSGDTKPSSADKTITDRIHEALKLFDIGLLDHFIVGNTVYSFAEHKQL